MLAGILFDEAGNRLSPVFTTNHGKRYRYYVGPEDHSSSTPSWRLPAGQLEKAVQDGLKGFLGNGPQVSAALGDLVDPSILTAATSKARALGIDRAQLASAIPRMLRKVTLAPMAITVAIDCVALAEMCCGDKWGRSDGEGSNAPLTLSLPMRLRRRGVEARIILEGNSSATPDGPLVELIGRAHLILRRLTDGTDTTFADVAKVTGFHIADVSRILPLAFLSPSLTEQMLSGRQPPELTARRLSRLENLPHLWSSQPGFVGI